MAVASSRVETFVELIRRAATDLPADIEGALEAGRKVESAGSLAEKALGTLLDNVAMARELSSPICQDTGTPVVWIHHPAGVSTRRLEDDFVEAVRQATARNFLRPNAVDTLTGKNTGHGTGRGIPYLHFEEWDHDRIEVRMIDMETNRHEQEAFVEYWGARADRALIVPLYSWPWDEGVEMVSKPCLKMREEMFFYTDGRAVLCCWDIAGRAVIGDVAREGVLDIWNGAARRAYAAHLSRGERNKIPLCSRCDAYKDRRFEGFPD